jgi:mRNA-degrading endonuclease RelE of RelBE toxin-antitoxin system
MRAIYYHHLVAHGDSQRLDPPVWDFIQRIIREKLSTQAESFGKPLRNALKGARVLRVSDWRVVFQIFGDRIHICVVRHRREGYRGIENRLT